MGPDVILKQLFEEIEKTYELVPRDIMYGSQAVYFHAIMNIPGKEKEREQMLGQKIADLLGLKKEDKYADLNVTMAPKEGGDILKGMPPVRVVFV